MIGIEAIGSYVPSGGRTEDDLMKSFSVDESFLRDKTGFLHARRKGENEDTSDLCVAAINDLVAKTGLDLAEIECLVVCTQNPDGHGIPHTSAIVHGKMSLPASCATFDVSLGCSGFVMGLSVVKSFMESNGMTRGLFVTADPYSKILNEEDKNTALLFGDAATATLLSDTPQWSLGRFVFGSDGSKGRAITTNDQRELTMNGRGVFVFSAQVVPQMIKDLLGEQSLDVQDVDYYLLHQGSRYIVETIGSSLGVSSEKAPFMAAETGNTVSSSIPLMLCDERFASAERLLLAGFGVGLSWAGCLLSRAR